MRRRCCVCESPLRETVDGLIRRGWAYDRIALEVGFVFSASAINRHALDCLGHRRKRGTPRRPAPAPRHPAPVRRRVPWEEIVREVSAHQRRRLGYVRRRKDE